MKTKEETFEWEQEILEIINEECKKTTDKIYKSKWREHWETEKVVGLSENDLNPDCWKNRLILSLQEECKKVLWGDYNPDYLHNRLYLNIGKYPIDEYYSILLQGTLAGDPEMVYLIAELLNYRCGIDDMVEMNFAQDLAAGLQDKCFAEGDPDGCNEHFCFLNGYDLDGYDYWHSEASREWKRKYFSPVYWYKQAAEAGSDLAKLWCAYCMETGTAGFSKDHVASEKMLDTIINVPDSLTMNGFEFLLKMALLLQDEYEDADLWEDEMCRADPAEWYRYYHYRPLTYAKLRNAMRILMANLGLVYALWESPFFRKPCFRYDIYDDTFDQSCSMILEQKGNWYRWCLDRGFNISLL